MDDSTLIGTVLDTKPVLKYQHDGEKFFMIPMSFNGVKLNVLYSEYTKVPPLWEMAKVKGTLMSDCSEGIPKCYFYANSIETVPVGTTQCSTLKAFGYVNRVGTLKTVNSCRDQLPVTLISRWILGGHSLVYTVMRDKLARQYQTLKKGSGITVVGELENYRDIVEIIVSDVQTKQ